MGFDRKELSLKSTAGACFVRIAAHNTNKGRKTIVQKSNPATPGIKMMQQLFFLPLRDRLRQHKAECPFRKLMKGARAF